MSKYTFNLSDKSIIFAKPIKFIWTRLFAAAAAAAIGTAVPIFCAPITAAAQDNWAADDSLIEQRKIERYKQLAVQSPDKSYAFTQLMNSVGKGEAYRKLTEEFEKKSADKPNDFNLAMILGHIYASGGRTAEAIAAYRRAAEIKKTPLTFISIADAEAQNKNFAPAVQAYEQAASLNPSREQKQQIFRALAEIAIYRRDIEGAKRYFAELISLEPKSVFVRRELSQIYAQNRLYEEARSVLADGMKFASGDDSLQLQRDIAELYELEGNDAEALKKYEAIADKLPASHWMQRDLTSRIIDIRRRSGDIQGLIQTLENRWKSPSMTQYLELADLYDEAGQPDKAIALIDKAVSKSPKSPEPLEKRVQFYRSHGYIDKMIAARQALIRAVPSNPAYRFELIDAFMQLKQNDKASNLIDDTVRSFSSDFDTLQRCAEYYQMLGKTQRATDIYESWHKSHPNDINAIEALGDIYYSDRAQKRALAMWKKIDSLPIDKNVKLETLARIYDEHGYSEEAEELYKKSLEANPSECQAYVQYADVLSRNGRLDAAADTYQALAKACPNDASRTMAAKQIASIARSRGAENKMMKRFQGACDLNPASAPDFLLFAAVASELDKPKEAIPTVQNYIDHHPKDTPVIKALAKLQAASGDFDSARRTLDSLGKSSETERYDALVAAAELDLESGDYAAAQDRLLQAIQISSADPDLHERLGDVLFKRRYYEEAEKQFAEAFQIDSRNFSLAFKDATALSILGKDKEASDLYVRILSEASDEALMLKAAQRAVDDASWRGTLDELAKSVLPLMRARKHREVYLDVILQLADAQAQPHILAVRSRSAESLFTARHALRELADKYSAALVESLILNDVSLSSRAMTLAEWIASASVIQVLGRKIENAGVSDTARLEQLQAIRAIAHAQLPAAVPILRECLSARYPRVLREHAVWALGLISANAAQDELVKVLDNNFDSFRALAVIGLARQNAQIDKIRAVFLNDPSTAVKNTAAWALAFMKDKKSWPAIQKQFSNGALKPYQIWAVAQTGPESAPRILETLWTGDDNARNMAARIIRSKTADISIKSLTVPEAQGSFIHGGTTYYQSNLDYALLLNHFSELASPLASSQVSANHAQSSPAEWITANGAAFTDIVSRVASGQLRLGGENANKDEAKLRMLRDLTSPDSLLHLDASDPAQHAAAASAVSAIIPQIQVWIEGSNRTLSGLAMRALALADPQKAVTVCKNMAKSSDTSKQINAVETLALISDKASRDALRSLAAADDYLVRAAAVNKLDPNDPDDRAALQNASKDTYSLVAQIASARLKPNNL